MQWIEESEAEGARDPWRPSVLRDVPDAVLRGLTYVVVDDLDDVEASVVMVLSAWPWLDLLGRLRYDLDDSVEVDLPAQDLLALTKRAKGRPRRPPRIGDAFAMMLPARTVTGLAEPIGPPVDITVDARYAARAAFYGAVSTPMGEHEVAGMPKHTLKQTRAVAVPEEWLAQGQARR